MFQNKEIITNQQNNIPPFPIISWSLRVNHSLSRQCLCKAWWTQCKPSISLLHTRWADERLTPVCSLRDLLTGFQSFLTQPEVGLLISCVQEHEQHQRNLSENWPNFYFLATQTKSKCNSDENDTLFKVSHSTEWNKPAVLHCQIVHSGSPHDPSADKSYLYFQHCHTATTEDKLMINQL